MAEEKHIIYPTGAKPLSLPLSPAVRYADLLFLSGQVSIDVRENRVIETDIERETEIALTNLKDLLEDAGSSLDCVLKVSVLLRDMDDYDRMNAAYRRFFPSKPPARTTIGNIALAKNYKVEIEAVAFVPGRD